MNLVDDKVYLAAGFVYWEEVTSPDGFLCVLKGYRDGEKTPVLVEPRFIHVPSGKILLDLWRTYHDYEVEFQTDGTIHLTLHLPHSNAIRQVEIDSQMETFAFCDNPRQREPIARLSERIRE